MKKFLLLTIGFVPPTAEIMADWNKWFASIGDAIVEHHGLASGIEITAGGSRDLPLDLEAITGSMVIQAEDMQEAEKIAQKCPSITSIRVYEIRSH
ncbi:MAG: hypothetical protein WBB64_13400 [Anaerolineales bacterium]